MSEKQKADPRDWIPGIGQAVKIPGGFLYCSSWQYSRDDRGNCSGEIILKFQVDTKEGGTPEPRRLDPEKFEIII